MQRSEDRTASRVNDCDNDLRPAGRVEDDPVSCRATGSHVDKRTDADRLHPDSVLAGEL
jgi:hypothetical protein